MKSWLKHPRKTECDKVREWLSPYLDDELDSDERQKADSHIESCQSCREELDSLRKMTSLLQHMPAMEPRHFFAVREAAKKKLGGKLKVLGAVTALVAVFLALVILGDITHYFDVVSPPAPTGPPWPPPSGVREYYWPVRETEFGLIVTLIALSVVTFIYWRKRIGKLRRK